MINFKTMVQLQEKIDDVWTPLDDFKSYEDAANIILKGYYFLNDRAQYRLHVVTGQHLQGGIFDSIRPDRQ